MVTGRRIRYVETDRTPIRDALLAAGAPPRPPSTTASGSASTRTAPARWGVLNDDVQDVTGRPPVSFAEFAADAAAAWRR
jgi:hypothetical protein